MKRNNSYAPISEDSLPEELRFDTPGINQGQIVTVSYADDYKSRSEADVGSAYKQIHDRSDNTRQYFKRVGEMWV